MMNWARIQMKLWTGKKNEHKVNVQKRWDDRNAVSKVFKRWKLTTGIEGKDSKQKEISCQRKGKRGLTYGRKTGVDAEQYRKSI
eukprot:3775341-Pleurochrysis_carterae.AAC.2